MDQIIARLQHLKLSSGITQQNNSPQIIPITTEQLSNICLHLYNENNALKKELLLISQNSSVSIPEWVK
jgi:hypothetical protein|tara:strand:+ start:341 stop:547 length:207 start_codon:yes stop_codon:yes gene_type:complete